MKILEIVGSINGGGVGSVVYNYISHMDLTTLDIDILTFKEAGKEQILEKPFKSLGCNVIYIDHRNKGYIKHFIKYIKILQKNKYDVVHCHFNEWSLPYLYYAKKNGVAKTVAHSHTSVNEFHGVKRIITEAMKKLLPRVATDRIACGKKAGDYLWGDLSYTILNNAIDLQEFKYNQEIRKNMRNSLGINDNDFIVGFVGRLSPEKNPMYFLEIIKELNATQTKCKGIIVGDGIQSDLLKEKTSELCLTDKVQFLGLRNDVQNILQAIDCILMPSIYEGMPVSAVEAQAVDLPIVMSSQVTLDVKFTERAYYLPLENIEKWVSLVSEIKNLCKKHIRKSDKEIISKKGFDISIESKKLRAIYLK
jgi:Glycosyltransferase